MLVKGVVKFDAPTGCNVTLLAPDTNIPEASMKLLNILIDRAKEEEDAG